MAFFRSKSQENPSDQQALERYRYLLRTAPPDAIEQAHEEAFGQLTPEQRRMALEELGRVSSPAERQQASEDPRSLARMATRAEMRQPGILERLFGSARGGGAAIGFGGVLAGSLLGSIAGTVLGSAIAHSFFDQHPFEGGDTVAESDAGAIESDASDAGFDGGVEDFGGDFEI